jgi:magnesium-protoporphyrin IX monomethyl ester (oxidative) cyclase
MVKTRPGEFLMELDRLPHPARHLLPMNEYFLKDRPHGTATRHKRSTPIITSRGCPAKCTFCSIHTVWGREFRGRSGANVLEELRLLVDRYAIKEIQIEDDNLTYNKPRAHEVLDKIIEADLGLSFTTPNGIAAWVLDRPLLEKLRKSGFYRLTIAVESGNQQVLHDIVKKPLQLKKVEEVVAMAKDLGFELDTFFVVGFPGETKEQIQDTFDFANKLSVDNAKFFIATPYPGTELYKIASESGYLAEGFDFHNGLSFTKGQISTPDFTADELETMVARASLKTQFNFLRKDPVSYLKSFFKDYFIKEPSAIFRYLWKSLTTAAKKT